MLNKKLKAPVLELSVEFPSSFAINSINLEDLTQFLCASASTSVSGDNTLMRGLKKINAYTSLSTVLSREAMLFIVTLSL